MFTLICGLPNAGKTTYSAQFDNVVHIDEVISNKRGAVVVEMIQSADDMCLEGVFPLADRRKMYREAYGGEGTRCIWLDTPYEECVRRENRGRKEIIFKNCLAFFEPPTLEEGWDEIIIIRGNNEQRINRQTED